MNTEEFNELLKKEDTYRINISVLELNKVLKLKRKKEIKAVLFDTFDIDDVDKFSPYNTTYDSRDVKNYIYDLIEELEELR